MPRLGGELDPLSEGEDNVLSRRFFRVSGVGRTGQRNSACKTE